MTSQSFINVIATWQANKQASRQAGTQVTSNWVSIEMPEHKNTKQRNNQQLARDGEKSG